MEREKLDISVEEAKACVWGDSENFEVISDTITGKSRWSDIHTIIIKRKSDGKCFRDTYRTGSNENCDDRPWDYSDPDFVEVFPVEKKVIVYE